MDDRANLEEILTIFNRKMRMQKKRVRFGQSWLSLRAFEREIQQYKIVFLPLNTTSMLQPLDFGIL